ncbi:amino acid racemase [Paenibacillus sp. J5C_2022]|uniref:aspartate/glutamate racemase family protein n=1 Tax=Paenibacillus sp. J5C2022 TaxID=2977129 RepID=UPI0021CE98B4|nr:amino acid racemase [Paenibacillus sp. J5C2022]MCU6708563.1 amino acid racemase [Paenibacillus sp. J5C2022]
MEHKSLGVIGGMGPKATAVFFDKVIACTAAEKDQEHINMIILNHATIPDRTSVILGGRPELFLEAVAKDLKLLEQAGAAHIAIPCNTSHYFYEDMQAMTTVPIINMVDETLRLIYEKYGSGSRIGILATSGTVQSGIYAAGCGQYGMELYAPDEAMQARVMDIIYTNVKSNQDFSPDELEALIGELVTEHGCRCVILACTELSCIKLSSASEECSIDAMQVLVETSITRSGKRVRQDAP